MALTQEDLQAIGALLEPIRADIQDLKAGQKDLQDQVERVRHSVVNIELEHLPKVSAALDGVVGSVQKNKEHNERITYLEKKADIHDARLFALESEVKKA